MRRACLFPLGFVVFGLAACAANGDPAPAGNGTAELPAQAAAVSSGAATRLDARDVAILVVERTPSVLRVTSSARRPRSAFGPPSTWNGSGVATHEWALRGAGGDVIAWGEIVARGALEAPPNPGQGVPAAHVSQETFSFVVKVPHPAAGERIEIREVGSALVGRWP